MSDKLHNIVITQSVSGGIKVYIDSVESIITYTNTYNIARNDIGFEIGKSPGWGTNGFYDNIRIYDRI